MSEKKGVSLPGLATPSFHIPLVDVELPRFKLPDFPPKPLKLTGEQMEILRYGVMDDVADVVPVVGDVAADLAFAEIRKRLKPEEFEQFIESNKGLPSSLALLKVFSEGQG